MLTFYINRAGKSLPKTQRDRLQRAAIEWQGFAFRSYSFSTHPDAGRWFNLLGFKPAGRVADCQVFVLRG